MSNSPPRTAGLPLATGQRGSANWFSIAMILLVVLVVGVAGAWSMQATDTAAFCSGCHTMDSASWTFKNSGHAKLACNDCHAPANLAAKIPFKMASGSNDIWNTVTKNIPDVIHANKQHKDVIQANCVRCHTPTIEKVDMNVKPYCADCHRSVPHKSRTPISTRKVADG